MCRGRSSRSTSPRRRKNPCRLSIAVAAIPGVGLDGDRYALKQGTFFKPEPDFELTLIEAEAIEAIKREYERRSSRRRCPPQRGHARRGPESPGRPRIHIGDVKIRGIRLCEPCSHLQALTELPVIKALRHRGGLRAQILSAGEIHVGDTVTA